MADDNTVLDVAVAVQGCMKDLGLTNLDVQQIVEDEDSKIIVTRFVKMVADRRERNERVWRCANPDPAAGINTNRGL